MKTENKLVSATMFSFDVSGACCLALGSLIPFLRETYGLSYDFAGMLVSLQSIGNLAAIGLMGILPVFLGRRRSVLITSIWMSAAYLLFTTGWGGAALLPAAVGFVAERSGIQAGMGVVTVMIALLLVTILISFFAGGIPRESRQR